MQRSYGRVIETKRGVEELWESDRDKERCRGVMGK